VADPPPFAIAALMALLIRSPQSPGLAMGSQVSLSQAALSFIG
jgi:hypothetical protein